MLNPLWNDPDIQSIMKLTLPIMHISGGADRYHQEHYNTFQQLAHPRQELITIPEADHSLDVEGSVERSLKAVEQAIRGVTKFLEA